MTSLPIAAELAPDHDARLQAVEEELRRKWEARIAAATAGSNALAVEEVHIDQSTSFNVVASSGGVTTMLPTTALVADGQGQDTTATTPPVVAGGATNPPVERVRLDESCAFQLANANTTANHSDNGDTRSFDVESNHRLPSHSDRHGRPHKTTCILGKKKQQILSGIAVLLVIVTAVLVPVLVTKNNKNDENPSEHKLTLPILKTVRERGFLRCKAESLESEKGVGFTIDLVRVMPAFLSRVCLFFLKVGLHHPSVSRPCCCYFQRRNQSGLSCHAVSRAFRSTQPWRT